MKKYINWKVFCILLVATVLSTLAALPYLFSIQSDLLSQLPISIPELVILQTIQSAILFSLLIFVGLFLSKKVGLTIPVLHAIAEKKNYKKVLYPHIRISVILGIVASGLIILGDWIFAQLGAAISTQIIETAIWQRFLASFYGGITEEVLMRLFLMTVLVWIGYKIKQTKDHKPTNIGVWGAIIIAALIFGLGHLPVTAVVTELTPLIITRALVLNGIGGIIFGWLYWRKGLEFAIISHFTADIMLQIVLPFVMQV